MRITDIRQLNNINIDIEELDFSEIEDEINDENIKNFSKFINLKKLDISFTNITNLFFLESLVNLIELDISNIPAKNFSSLHKLTKLKILTAYDTEFQNLLSLKNLPLRELYIGRAKVQNLDALKTVQSLEKIDLSGNENLKDITALGELKNLKELIIEGTALDSNGLNCLEGLANLKILAAGEHLNFAAKAVLSTVNFKKNCSVIPQKTLSSSNQLLFASPNAPNIRKTIKKASEPMSEPPSLKKIVSSEIFQTELLKFYASQGIIAKENFGLIEMVQQTAAIVREVKKDFPKMTQSVQ